MALELSHMRFAYDIKEDLLVKNIDQYLSGAIYPDSRYVTGIDRHLTHDKKCYEKSFYGDDDFKKGWATHLVYDLIQGDVMSQLFPEILATVSQGENHGRDSWIIRSAFKILQDREDAQEFNIVEHFSCLEYVAAPCGEDVDGVKKYNGIIIDLYKESPKTSIEDLGSMWTSFGVDEEDVQQIKSKAVEFQSDKVVMANVKKMYQKTVEVYNKEGYFI